MKPTHDAENQWDSSIRALNAALESIELDKAAQAVMGLLWYVAAMRTDYEDLPMLLAYATAPIHGAGEAGEWVEMMRLATAVVEKITRLYGTEDEPMMLRDHCLAVMTAAENCDFAGIGQTLELCLGRLLNLGFGDQRLPVVIEDDQIRIGRHTRVSFHRTLRIPEDGKQYPLPAGFGKLPILRVADYVDKVPRKWLEDGGFFIPLYQREALFLEFEGEDWRPSILQVAVGGINAITGEASDESIRSHKQDYVVIPDQKWLDGINTGEGVVGQFVAMPLGHGYTIEEQLTDEAKFGGLQLVAFEAKAGRFPEEDPADTARRKSQEIERRCLAKERRIRNAQRRIATEMTEIQRVFVLRLMDGQALSRIAHSVKLDKDRAVQVYFEVIDILRWNLGSDGLFGIERKEVWPAGEPQLDSRSPLPRFEADGTCALHSQAIAGTRLNSRNMAGLIEQDDGDEDGAEMGLARGGSIKQQIKEDTYGVQSWDKMKKGRVCIHIVNSEMFEAITGGKSPETPISVDQYKKYGIPWFDAYDENAQAVMAAKKFQNVKGVSAIDRAKGVKDRGVATPIEIPQEVMRRIKPPTREEHIGRLTKRIDVTWQAGQWLIAHRESSCLLDIDPRNAFALQIRADCNNHLERYLDAECDASECLEFLPESVFALTRRAQGSISRRASSNGSHTAD